MLVVRRSRAPSNKMVSCGIHSRRLSAPVYPGETIRTDVWKDGNIVSFRASVVERDMTVLKNGRAEIGPGDAD